MYLCMENHVHSTLANRHKKESRHGEQILTHTVNTLYMYMYSAAMASKSLKNKKTASIWYRKFKKRSLSMHCQFIKDHVYTLCHVHVHVCTCVCAGVFMHRCVRRMRL